MKLNTEYRNSARQGATPPRCYESGTHVRTMHHWRGGSSILKRHIVSGECRYCHCTEMRACMTLRGPCAWADRLQTVCTAPRCLTAAIAEKVTIEPWAAAIARQARAGAA